MRLFRARPRPTKYVLTSSTGRKPRPWCEFLEDRTLLSGLGFVQPHYVLKGPSGPVTPSSTSAPTGYTPSQILHGYGFDQISFGGGVAADGTGSTIAIVDAFDDPTIGPDLHQFDLQFHLPDPPMTVVNQTGGSVLPVANPGWASEIALDVQWSHAIAPKARILLVEANDNYFSVHELGRHRGLERDLARRHVRHAAQP